MLTKQIARQGVISFEKFMELALYCPELGYYERGAASIGRGGDFFTAVSVGPLFGRLLAHQFADWLTPLDGEVRLVEAGAHDGQLARDVLGALRREHPQLFARARLALLEPSPERREWQRATLREFSNRVDWWSSWADAESAGGVRGVIYANELLDAFPVRRLGWDARAQAWFEWGVDCAGGAGGEFSWARIPVSDQAAMQRQLAQQGIVVPPELEAVLPDEFTVEVAPGASEWWRGAAHALRQGWLMTLDYGREGPEFLRPERGRGTLRAFRQHRLVENPLVMPGEQDLTADVNFTAIRGAGEAAGLVTAQFASQEQFFGGLVRRLPAAAGGHTNWTPEEMRQFQTLVHPEQLGRAFRVLIQTR
jgi:SAM-dependent MidA family methyltransferase